MYPLLGSDPFAIHVTWSFPQHLNPAGSPDDWRAPSNRKNAMTAAETERGMADGRFPYMKPAAGAEVDDLVLLFRIQVHVDAARSLA